MGVYRYDCIFLTCALLDNLMQNNIWDDNFGKGNVQVKVRIESYFS